MFKMFEKFKKKLTSNPKSGSDTFINNAGEIFKYKIREYDTWYNGDADELNNFYRVANIDYLNNNPIYTTNDRQFFWSISQIENQNFKKVHSGMPNAIISTLTNIVGAPKIDFKNASSKANEEFDKILKDTGLLIMLQQKQIPFTLVEGDGAIKINVANGELYLEYYKALDFKPYYEGGKLKALEFFNYYQVGEHTYTLIEKREIGLDGLYITYKAFDDKDKETDPKFLDENASDVLIRNYYNLLAIHSRFFENNYFANRGKSIFTGKVELFDDLDLTLSQASATVRVSTPVEYYDSEVLEHDEDGNVKLPKIFNRQFVAKYSPLSGDGVSNGSDNGITTTQPNLNFSQYAAQVINLQDQILNGIMSPATLGFNIGSNISGVSQREREKVTIQMRNNIIVPESDIIKSLVKQILDVKTNFTYQVSTDDISVKFDEFATPTFDEELKVLGDAYSRNNLSTEMYVELLYKDKLSEDEKLLEIYRLNAEKQAELLSTQEFINGETRENENTKSN